MYNKKSDVPIRYVKTVVILAGRTVKGIMGCPRDRLLAHHSSTIQKIHTWFERISKKS